MGDHTPPSFDKCVLAIDALRRLGNKTEAAKSLDIPKMTFYSWLDHAKRTHGLEIPNIVPEPKGRRVTALMDGIVVVAADFHYWPGEAPSTAHRALVKLTKELEPNVLVANGDVCDFATVSRHPPLGWTSLPTAAEEIEAAQERLAEWEDAGGKAERYWPIGNHDARMETFIASKTPELRGIKGTSLKDHFSLWQACYSVLINDEPGGLIVKHRLRGGMHAPYNNVMAAGRSIATGHLHSQKIAPFTNYNAGTLYGVDVGCIADPYADAFAYLEDNPRNWRSGFAVFTFKDGMLLPPELVTVIEPGIVFFRGKTIAV